MKTIRLIASDLDGTLLTNNHTVSDKNRANIRLAVDNGVQFILASGRPWLGIRPYIKELGLDIPGNYCISNNGALIHDASDGTVLNAHTLNFDDYLELEALSRKIGVHIHGATLDKIITTNTDISPYTVRESFLTNMPLEYSPISETNPSIVLAKLMLIDEPEVLAPALKKIPDDLFKRFTMVKSAPYFFEILNAHSSKGNAVSWIANKLNIDMSHVMCIGDQENDISMIKLAGLGVAMGNAVPATLAEADVVTQDNENDGVAEAIAKYVL
ncbi:sugar-phosphatase [Escherichia coli]|uniref:sugar-phosphatase n=1 Tax=Escherichia coli TaxID=562 RepID=UPI003D365DA3